MSTFECAMNRIERPDFCAMTVISYDELGSSHSFPLFPLFLIVFLKAMEDIASGRCFDNCADATTTISIPAARKLSSRQCSSRIPHTGKGQPTRGDSCRYIEPSDAWSILGG